MNKRTCPNCDREINKDNKFVKSQTVILRINNYYGKNNEKYCQKCSNELFKKINTSYNRNKTEIKKTEKEIKIITDYLSKHMPIVTTHTPYNWEYKTCGIVTGLSNLGTGAFSDVGSSISDFLGTESGLYNSKIKKSEENCFNQLILQSLKKGGNAIIGVDIDYNEIGGSKQIQMVAMAGTAVNLTNIEQVIDEKLDIKKYNEKINAYRKIMKDFY